MIKLMWYWLQIDDEGLEQDQYLGMDQISYI